MVWANNWMGYKVNVGKGLMDTGVTWFRAPVKNGVVFITFVDGRDKKICIEFVGPEQHEKD